MTDDLVAFLRARLGEDERVARAACWDDQSAEWTARPPQASYERYTVVDYLGDGVVAVAPENADDDGVGQHIARHDPTRVLAEVEAKRRIVARCDAALGMDDGYGAAFLAEQVLRDLAAPYRERPGYRPEWAPNT